MPSVCILPALDVSEEMIPQNPTGFRGIGRAGNPVPSDLGTGVYVPL